MNFSRERAGRQHDKIAVGAERWCAQTAVSNRAERKIYRRGIEVHGQLNMVDTRRSAPCFAFFVRISPKMGGKKEEKKERKQREKQKYFNNRDFKPNVANVLHPSNFRTFFFAFSLSLPFPCFSLFFFKLSLHRFPFRCWQITRLLFFFFRSLPRACFLYLTISLELVPSTVNILLLSLHFLFPELFPPPRVVFYYHWIPPPQSLPVIPPGNPSCSATNVKIFQSLNFIAIPTPFQRTTATEEGKQEWYITSNLVIAFTMIG